MMPLPVQFGNDLVGKEPPTSGIALDVTLAGFKARSASRRSGYLYLEVKMLGAGSGSQKHALARRFRALAHLP